MKLEIMWNWLVKKHNDEDVIAEVFRWLERLVMGFLILEFMGLVLYFVERDFFRGAYILYTGFLGGIFNGLVLVISLVLCGLGIWLCYSVFYSELMRTDAYETLCALEREEDYKDESYVISYELRKFLRG